MAHILEHRNPLAFDDMSPHDAKALLTGARSLQRAAQAGRIQPLLRDKNLGLLCEADNGDAALFRRAAVELGAHVAHIRPTLSQLSTPQDVRNMARMLGRLYDAVECQGLASDLVQQVASHAGVPIYAGLASRDHPTAALAELLGGDASPADNRRYLLQAVLLTTIT